MQQRELLVTIQQAFPDAPAPAASEIGRPDSEDAGFIAPVFVGRPWKQVDPVALEDLAVSPEQLTPLALAYYLPAFLAASATLPDRGGRVTDSILFALLNPDETASPNRHRYFLEWTALLTAEQESAVRAYLEYVRAAYAIDYPSDPDPRLDLDEPGAALRRYWAAKQ